MTRCPQTEVLLEAGLDPSEHCDTCRAFSAELIARHGDLDRALDAFARSGDAERAIANALRAAPQGPQRANGWDRWFHGSLIAVAALVVLVFLGIQLVPAPPPPPLDDTPATAVEEQLAEEIQAAADASLVPWNALTEVEWRDQAKTLRQYAIAVEEKHALDDASVRGLAFDLWTQTGRAAENANDPAPPHYDRVARTTVNMAWYRAGSLAAEHPDLLDGLPQGDLKASIVFYAEKIEDGTLPSYYVASPVPAARPGPKDPFTEAVTRTADTAALQPGALSSAAWGGRADELRQLGNDIESRFPFTAEAIRPVLFALWVQAGRSAQSADNPVAPHYATVGGQTVNVAWHKAASLAALDPGLLDRLNGQPDAKPTVLGYLTQIEAGDLPTAYPKAPASP